MNKLQEVEYLCVHCSATPPYMDIGVEEIRRWHQERGWSDIGYHFVIRRDGTLEIGRDESFMGAHERSINDRSLAVCLVGGVASDRLIKEDGESVWVPENNFTEAQFESLKSLCLSIKKDYSGIMIVGHNQFSSKACPSFDVKKWLSTWDRNYIGFDTTRGTPESGKNFNVEWEVTMDKPTTRVQEKEESWIRKAIRFLKD